MQGGRKMWHPRAGAPILPVIPLGWQRRQLGRRRLARSQQLSRDMRPPEARVGRACAARAWRDLAQGKPGHAISRQNRDGLVAKNAAKSVGRAARTAAPRALSAGKPLHRATPRRSVRSTAGSGWAATDQTQRDACETEATWAARKVPATSTGGLIVCHWSKLIVISAE
jgi:hypothetical protein